MSLVLNDEQQMLVDSAAALLRERSPVSSFRELRANGRPYDGSLWHEMREMGWTGMLLSDSLGGSDFGVTGMGLLATESGKVLCKSPLLGSAGMAAGMMMHGLDNQSRDDVLRAIGSGESIATVAHQEGNRFTGWQSVTKATESGSGWMLTGTKRCVAYAQHADKILLSAKTENGLDWFVVDAENSAITHRPLRLMDSGEYADIEINQLQLDYSACLRWESDAARASAQVVPVLLTACELYGCSHEAFSRTIEYLKEREQFGRKIGSFQALQHRAAECYVQLQLLQSVLLDALAAIDQSRSDAEAACSHAKAMANEVAALVCNEAIQMHGGIGITDELDIGLFYKRARVLQSLWGDTAWHTARFATLNGF